MYVQFEKSRNFELAVSKSKVPPKKYCLVGGKVHKILSLKGNLIGVKRCHKNSKLYVILKNISSTM